MALYYPQVVVELRLRVDPTFQGFDPNVGAMGYGQQTLAQGGNSNQTPMLFSGQADAFTLLLYVKPTSCEWEFPAHRVTGTWSCKIAWRDLPVDPRIFTAVGAAIYADTTSEDAVATARQIFLSNTGPRNGQLPTPGVDNLIMVGPADLMTAEHDENGSILQIEGRDMRSVLIDSPFPPDQIEDLDFDAQLDAVVSDIVSRHPRAKDMLVPEPDDLAKTNVTQRRVDVGNSAVTSVAIATDKKTGSVIPAKLGSFIRVAKSDWPDGIPTVIGATAPVQRHRKPAKTPKKSDVQWKKTKTRASAPTNENTSFWDMITQVCYLCGAIPVFYGPYLFLRNAKTMFESARLADGTVVATPFIDGKPRIVKLNGVPTQINLPTLVYGVNLETLKLTRKFQGRKAMVVKVVCADPSSDKKGLDRLIEVEYPTLADQALLTSFASPSGRGSESSFVRVAVHGLRDPEQLRGIAKAIFEETMRNEITGSFTTKDLASLCEPDSANNDPDLLRLRPGMAVVIDIATSNLDSFPPYVAELVRNNTVSDDEAVNQVAKLFSNSSVVKAADYNSTLYNFAKYVVYAMRGRIKNLPKTFYVTTARVNWTAEDGMDVSCDFTNYIDPQVNRVKQPWEEVPKTPGQQRGGGG